MLRVQAIAGTEAARVLLYWRGVDPQQNLAETLRGQVASTKVFYCEVDPALFDATGVGLETKLNRTSSAFGRASNMLLSTGDYNVHELSQNFEFASIAEGVKANARGCTPLTGRLMREFLVVVLDAQGRVLRFQLSGRPPVDPEHRWRVGMSAPGLPDELKDVQFLVDQRTAAPSWRGEHPKDWALHVSALECDEKLLSHIAELRATVSAEVALEASEEEKWRERLLQWRLEAEDRGEPGAGGFVLVLSTDGNHGRFDEARLRTVEKQASQLGFNVMYTTPQPDFRAWATELGEGGRLCVGNILIVGDNNVVWPPQTTNCILPCGRLANYRPVVTASGLDELFTTYNGTGDWVLADEDFVGRRVVYLKNPAAKGLTVNECKGRQIPLVVRNPRFASASASLVPAPVERDRRVEGDLEDQTMSEISAALPESRVAAAKRKDHRDEAGFRKLLTSYDEANDLLTQLRARVAVEGPVSFKKLLTKQEAPTFARVLSCFTPKPANNRELAERLILKLDPIVERLRSGAAALG